jgi:hypothetical protein
MHPRQDVRTVICSGSASLLYLPLMNDPSARIRTSGRSSPTDQADLRNEFDAAPLECGKESMYPRSATGSISASNALFRQIPFLLAPIHERQPSACSLLNSVPIPDPRSQCRGLRTQGAVWGSNSIRFQRDQATARMRFSSRGLLPNLVIFSP